MGGAKSGSAKRPETALEERGSPPLLRSAGGGLQHAPQLRGREEALLQGLIFDRTGEPLHDLDRPGKGIAGFFGFFALLVYLSYCRPYLPELTWQADLLRQGAGLLQTRQRLPCPTVLCGEHREHPEVDLAEPAVPFHPLAETLYLLAGQLLIAAP